MTTCDEKNLILALFFSLFFLSFSCEKDCQTMDWSGSYEAQGTSVKQIGGTTSNIQLMPSVIIQNIDDPRSGSNIQIEINWRGGNSLPPVLIFKGLADCSGEFEILDDGFYLHDLVDPQGRNYFIENPKGRGGYRNSSRDISLEFELFVTFPSHPSMNYQETIQLLLDPI